VFTHRLVCSIAVTLALAGVSPSGLAQSQPAKGMRHIVSITAPIEKVAGGFQFIEGPVWVADAQGKNGKLLFSDIPADVIYQYTGSGAPTSFRKPSGNTNGNTLDLDGNLICCEHGNRRVSRVAPDGTVTTLAERYQGKRLNSPNDIVVRKDGAMYFTDPPYGIQKNQEELGYYGVYRLAPDGNLTLLVQDFVRPNGIALSPDEKKLYVNDTEKNHIRVFDIQADGSVANGRIFAVMDSKEPGGADGMKFDVKGNVYSTGPGGVWIFNSKGEFLGRITPPENPANIGWGGADNKTLYMTALTGLYRIELKIPGTRPHRKKK
jgi:gluconolactonase